MNKPQNLQRWRVVLIRKKGQPLATIEAASADEAIERAIELYSITDPKEQKRLIAHRVE